MKPTPEQVERARAVIDRWLNGPMRPELRESIAQALADEYARGMERAALLIARDVPYPASHQDTVYACCNAIRAEIGGE